MRIASLLCFLGSWLLTTPATGEDVSINQVRNRSTYMLDLMKLALSYSDTRYRFVETDERLSKNAEREALLNGTLAVIWGGTSQQQEADFTPIRVDGYRGLMSLRFLIIRQGDQPRFNRVYTSEDLKQLRFGQGRSWQDTRILQASGLTVEGSSKKPGLFHMLEGGRFDAFPRGATEAWVEAREYRHLGLTVEQSLIIKYPLPTYFFVNRNRTKLAADIRAGLGKALLDGSFDDYFYGNERVQAFLAQANLEYRRVIELDNPFLPPSAAVDEGGYNLSIEQLVAGARRHKQASLERVH